MKYRVFLVNEAADKNIAVVQNTIDEIVSPFKLVRDSSLVIEDEEPSPINPQKIARKKAEVLEYRDPEEEKVCAEERVPWLLEDSEQRAFVGRHMETRITEEHKVSYYAMIKERNEIYMYKINKWYKFSPKIQYETLNLEEAEAKMQKKVKETHSAQQRRAPEEPKEDEVEYRQVFEDDEEGEAQIEDSTQKRRKKLDPAGKNLKRLVQNYEESVEERSTDTHTDSAAEKESEEKEEKRKLHQPEITELEIKTHLAGGAISIKKLIEKLKPRFRENPQNKEIVRALIRRLCNIKTDSKTGEKKLVLKNSLHG